jgi:hypothetical protein
MSDDLRREWREFANEAFDALGSPPYVPDGFASPFPHDEFQSLLADAIRSSFADLRTRLSGESMYGYFLWLSPECRSVCAAATSEENLDRVVARYLHGGKYRARAGDLAALLRVDLRWSVADDWPIVNEPCFDRVNKILDDFGLNHQDNCCDGYYGRLVETNCLAALARADAEGLFGRSHEREALTVNLSFGAIDDESVRFAIILNPTRAHRQYEDDLKLLEIAMANLEYLGTGKGSTSTP